MKKLLITALIALSPAVATAKKSLIKRGYHAGIGTGATIAGGLTLLGLYDLATYAQKELSKRDFTKEIFDTQVDLKPIALTTYGCVAATSIYGLYKLGTFIKYSFDKSFSSSSLLEITRSNYTAEVTESSKPVIMAVLPETEELKDQTIKTFEGLQKSLPQYTFATIELAQAYDILGIKTTSILLVKDGDLRATREGIYNDVQIQHFIQQYL